MESKANYGLVGLISLLVFVLAAGFIYWFALSDNKVSTKQYRIVFTGTVTGLSSGTQVLFNGIKVGQVRTLRIDPEDPGRVLAEIEISDTAPVKTDTKAVLESQGLTGVSFVQLSGGSPTAPALTAKQGEDLPVIIAGKSDLQTIMEGVRDTIQNASVAFKKLETFVDENQQKTTDTLDNIEKFSSALASNSDQLQTFLASMSEAGGQVGPLATDLRKLSNHLNDLVADVKPAQVGEIVDNTAQFTQLLNANSDKVNQVFADAVKLTTSLNDSADTISEVAKALDPKTISGIVEDVSKASSAVAGNVDSFNTLVANATDASTRIEALMAEVPPEQVGEIVDNVTSFTRTLSANNDNINQVVADAVKLTTSLNDSAGTISEVANALDPKAISGIVDDVSKASTALAGNVDSFNTMVANATEASTRINSLAGEVEPGKVGKAVDDISTFSSTLAGNNEKVDRFFNEATRLTASLNQSADKIATIADRVNAITTSVDPAVVGKMVDDLSSVSTTIGDNRGNVDKFMADMTDVSSKLAESVDKVQAIVDRIDTMSASADTESLFKQLTDAADAVKVLAQNLDSRTQAIASGLGRFSNQGLAEYSGLATDARQVLRRLDKVLQDLDRDPQRIIFGGDGSSGVREYTKQ